MKRTAPQSQFQRIGNELRAIQIHPTFQLQLTVPVEEIQNQPFCISFEGPVNSCYEGKSLTIQVEFPTNYPRRAMKIQFLTPIFHPAVGLEGQVGLQILKNWSPAYSLREVLEQLLDLLCYPDTLEETLNEQAYRLFMKNREEFYKIVSGSKQQNTDEESVNENRCNIVFY